MLGKIFSRTPVIQLLRDQLCFACFTGQDALACLGANYTVQGAPMTGLIQARQGSTGSITLDLQQVPVRLWAVELAALHRTVQDVAEEKARRYVPGAATSARSQA